MDTPCLTVSLACVDNNSAGEDAPALPCADLVLASENAPVRNAYPLSLGDAVEDDFVRMLFLPKSSGSGSSSGAMSTLERQDYRQLKRRKMLVAAVGTSGLVGA